MLKPKQKKDVQYQYNSTFKRKSSTNKHRKKKKKAPRDTEISEHWNRLIELGPASWNRAEGRLTIHHCHSGSISQSGIHRGIGQKQNDWLTICLPESLHVMGPMAIDGAVGVLTWEAEFETQMKSLIWICQQLNVNVFEKAGYGIDIHGLDG